MHRMKLSPVAILALAAACPEAVTPCETNFDCGVGFTCVDGACAANESIGSGGPGGGGGGGGEGEGEGEVNEDVVINDEFEGGVSMMLPGSAIGESDDFAVVGEYTAGGVDQLRFFDLASGEFVDEPEKIDLQQTSIGGNPASCNVDHVSLENDVETDLGGDELWFSCTLTGLQQAVDDDELQQQVIPGNGSGADLIVALEQEDELDPNITQRRVYARRGTPDLIVEQVDLTGDRATRDTDSVVPVFREIAGIFLVTETDQDKIGDLVLVFDRAYPGNNDEPALVPLERPFVGDNTIWDLPDENGSPWRVLPLPVETHAVRVGVVPEPANFDTDDRTDQNLELYLPTEGLVIFARLEDELERGTGIDINSNTGFDPLEFDDDRPDVVPSPAERILLQPVPGDATSVFYVLYDNDVDGRAYGWKLKLRQNAADEDFSGLVERALFNDESSDVANGLVTIPTVDNAVWISLRSRNELHRIPFDIGF